MTKFGLLSYANLYKRNHNSTNLGDEIQSIAASYFLPKIDYFVQREGIKEFRSDEKTKVIMNGWYIYDEHQWPISDDIEPLFVSMHISGEKKKFLKRIRENRKKLEKYGPMGGRDFATVELLNNAGIKSFFSGCLTLTLPVNPYTKKKEYVLCVDVPSEVSQKVKGSTKRDVYSVTPIFDLHHPGFRAHDKFVLAQNLLNLYQSASCVVTTRLHVAMPCLALKTPVLLLDDSNGKDQRFGGLDAFVRKVDSHWYVDNMDYFCLDNPQDNSENYISTREKLINLCENFTGCKHRQQSPLFIGNSLEEQNLMSCMMLGRITGECHTGDVMLYNLKVNM